MLRRWLWSLEKRMKRRPPTRSRWRLRQRSTVVVRRQQKQLGSWIVFCSCFPGLCCASGALVFSPIFTHSVTKTTATMIVAWLILEPMCGQSCSLWHGWSWAHSVTKTTATMPAPWAILCPSVAKAAATMIVAWLILSPLRGQSYSYNDCFLSHLEPILWPKPQLSLSLSLFSLSLFLSSVPLLPPEN